MNLNVTEQTEAITGRSLFAMLGNPAGLKASDLRALIFCALKEGSRILSETGRPDPRLTLEWVGQFCTPVSGSGIVNKIMAMQQYSSGSESLAPYVPTPHAVVSAWLEKERPAAPGAKRFLDLGCGMGVLLAHFHKNGFACHGFEVNEDRYYSAAGRLFESISNNGGHEGQVTKGDIVKLLEANDADLLSAISEADVVWAYWLPITNEQHLPRVAAHMKTGAILLSHNYAIPTHPRLAARDVEVIEMETEIHYLHSSVVL